MADIETTSHRLVLPADANHHGTLYAGSLLRYALEAAYATASRAVGPAANLMLRRVLSLECRRSVPVGSLVEIRCGVLQVRQAYLVVGVVGMPLVGSTLPWMDGRLRPGRLGRPPGAPAADGRTAQRLPALAAAGRSARQARRRPRRHGRLDRRGLVTAGPARISTSPRCRSRRRW
jgi:acyl-CoA thioesterase YciA